MIEQSEDELIIVHLYDELISCWNTQNAVAFAELFALDATLVGFDGTEVKDRTNIADHLRQVFNDHPTGKFVSVIREVKFITDDAALLRAVAGMIPQGQHKVKPELNAVQSLVVVNCHGAYEICHFQNTPAAWHGRDKDRDALTAELNGLLL